MVIAFLIITFIVIIGLWYVISYNNFQDIIIKLYEAEKDIDENIRGKYDLLIENYHLIKETISFEDNNIELLEKVKNKKISNFDMDRLLNKVYSDINIIFSENKALKKSETCLKSFYSLDKTEGSLIAAKKYYNENISIFNKKVRSFPTSIISKVCKYKEKPFFDGKDLTDDEINDFKL